MHVSYTGVLFVQKENEAGGVTTYSLKTRFTGCIEKFIYVFTITINLIKFFSLLVFILSRRRL